MMGKNFLTAGKLFFALSVVLSAILICAVAISLDNAPWRSPAQPVPLATNETVTETGSRATDIPHVTPSPDPPRPIPTLRIETEDYIVQAGDTLNQIGRNFGVSPQAIAQANGLENPNLLEIGQRLTIPPPDPGSMGPDDKIIPDSELVYSPATIHFDLYGFILQQGGYLARYSEELDGVVLSGAQVVERISYEYSINPRLILSVLEYQSGWVTRDQPDEATLDYPIGIFDTRRQGLYRQLAWAANNLNMGYYLWRVNGLSNLALADGEIVPISTTINAGTAGVQYFFSQIHDRGQWDQAVSHEGLFATYSAFFGNPFDLAIEPLIPHDLAQPPMQLPFEPGEVWSFTGGPHGGWGNGSAWAALDFAPPGRPRGCAPSDAWVVAVADGLIVRSADGAVVQDLDGDGFEQTGWTVLYLHIDSINRVPAGTYLQAGERIGQPSCEGGFSTGTHLHIARRYNGEWIPADQDTPFVMDGWVSSGFGREYNGTMTRNGVTAEASIGRHPTNEIQR